MTRWIFFIVIVLGIYTMMHLFLYKRLAVGLALTPNGRFFLRLFFIAAALSLVLGQVLHRLKWADWPLFIGYVWLGTLSIGLSVFLLEVVAGLIWSEQRRTIVLAALVLTLLLSGYSLFNGLRRPAIKTVYVPLVGLPQAMNGFRIVQLSDLHLGDGMSLPRFRRIVEQVNALKPDLVVITGDLLDADICNGSRFCEAAAELRARCGVLAVTGNHEFYAGVGLFEQAMRRNGWRALRNDMVEVEGLQIVGVDDPGRHPSSAQPGFLQELLARCDRRRPIILLSHQPHKFEQAVAAGVGLQLSGHTHAGQIPPMDLLVWLSYTYPFGLHRRERSHIYVSVGTGTWGPPMRLFSRGEIGEIILTPSS